MSTVPQGAIVAIVVVGVLVVIPLILKLIGFRIIGNTEVGIVEKLWSRKGSLHNKIIALNGEAGFQPDVLRGGFHMVPGYQYRVHKVGLVTIHRGRIGYVFARDGQPLGRYSEGEQTVSGSGQTLARVVANGDFTDVRRFLSDGGQQGPQRAILREGTYAVNLSQFTVISGVDAIHFLPMGNKDELAAIQAMAKKIDESGGFKPIVIDGATDQIGIVTVHDGPSLPQGDIIAPTVGDSKDDPHYHNNFQDPEAFLRAGGFRGRQYQVLTEGTYFINRLFATTEFIPKTVIEPGEAGVVVSFHGERGKDVSGEAYTHGELCEKGGRGIWSEPLLPGKYPFNTYAGQVIKVPTVNLILKWDKNEQSEHRLDEGLKEIGLITKDAFEPELPLSVVISIDYRKAPYVIQRFGSVKKLIDQSLDPLVSSYFKNEGQKRTIIELIQQRSEIQEQATKDMKNRFAAYDLNLQEVLIGTPHSRPGDTQIEMILNQLRDRQVAREQKTTYGEQKTAQESLRELNEAKANSEMQAALTQSKLQISVEENQGQAQATRAVQDAKRTVTMAEAEAEKLQVMAGADAKRTQILADAEAKRIEVTATAQAKATSRTKIAEAIGVEQLQQAYGGAKLMVMKDMAMALAEAIKSSPNSFVPKTMVNMGGSGAGGATHPILEIFSMLGMKNLGLLEDLAAPSSDGRPLPENALSVELRKDATDALGLSSAEPSKPEAGNGKAAVAIAVDPPEDKES